MWAKLLRLPRPYLYAGILFFATLGAYAVNLQVFDLAILLVLGILGFAMRRFGFPILPLVIGLILGPRAEGQLRKSLQLSAGDISGLWSEPIAVVVYIIAAIILAWPLVMKIWRRSHPKRAGLLSADVLEPVHSGPRNTGEVTGDDSGAPEPAPSPAVPGKQPGGGSTTEEREKP